jgi:hypothetical protein
MSNQLQITGGAKVRNLEGVLTGTSGVVGALGINVANGIPKLDSNAKILVSQLPNSVMEYKGTWNAATNTPTLANGTGNQGDVYLCNVAGTTNFGAGAITFAVGDQVIYSGTIWQKAGGSTGTVTSVAITESGDALTITGSPITTSGTINIGFAGTSGQYINGAGGLTTFPSLTGFVPYTGATSNVNLGEYGLSGGYLGLDTTPTGTPTSVGTLSWDDTYLTPKVITGTGATTLQVGQEEVVLIHNNTGSTLTDGQVVYINGSTGNLPTVALADASSETTSAATLGVVTETITNGSNGFITISGNVNGLNTTGYTAGDILWLSETAGQFTNVKPVSPAHLVLIGYVVKVSGGNGSILVKIQNTQELKECSDVLFTSLANNDILQYKSATGLWVNSAGTTTNIAEGTNLYYTDARSRSAISLTTTGTSGAATYNSTTGVFNIPNYGSALSGYVPYNGATTNVNLGGWTLTGGGLNVEASGGFAGAVNMRQASGHSLWTGAAYTSMYAGFGNTVTFYFSNDGRNFTFDGSIVSTTSPRTYVMPDANGTLALTSDIPSLSGYVPYTGATSNVNLGSNYLTVAGSNRLWAGAGTANSSLALGDSVLMNATTGAANTGIGSSALYYLTTGNYNTAVGWASGRDVTTGSQNIFYGNGAGFGITTGSNNIDIANRYVTGTTYASGVTTGSYNTIIGRVTGLDPATSNNIILADGQGNIRYQYDIYGNNNFFGNVQIYKTTTSSLGFNLNSDGSTTSEIVSYGPTTGIRTLALSGSDVRFLTGTAGGGSWTEKMRLNTSGNFSIGNTNDTYKLDVTGTGRFTGPLNLTGTASDTNQASGAPFIYLQGGGSSFTTIQQAVGKLSFWQFNGSIFVNTFNITNAGNVGIGTSSPVTVFQTVGAGQGTGGFSGASYGIRIDNGGAFSSGMSTIHGTDNSLYGSYQPIMINGSDVRFGTSATERMRITNGGVVLIGGTSVNAISGAGSLQVYKEIVSLGGSSFLGFANRASTNIFGWYGNTNAILYNDGVGNIASINASSGAYTATSDINKKKDLEDSTIGLNAIMGIKPTLYRMKFDSDDTDKELGFIAQQVKEFIPQAYVESGEGEDKFIGLTDRPIIAALVKAIQEQQLQIEELKAKIK